jgi:hypothetical protein
MYPAKPRATHQVIVNTTVQYPLFAPAVPHLLVVVLETLPVQSKLLQTVLVDIRQSASSQLANPYPCACSQMLRGHISIHACCTSCDLSSFFQTLEFSSACRIRLAFHVVVIVRPTASSDEERSAHKRCRAGSNLLDLRYGVWQRGRVIEKMLVEPNAVCQRVHSLGDAAASLGISPGIPRARHCF